LFQPFLLILFRAHQCHYEQFGEVDGVAVVDGVDHQLHLNVMRDHTHGSTRDWRLMHRYGIQNFTTKTGFRSAINDVININITSWNLGSILQTF